MKKASRAERLVALLCLVVALIVIGAAHGHHLATPTEGGDIYFSWLEGKRIFAGSNPYARVLTGDFLHNEKYATHLPLFYVTGGISQLAGLERFPEWIHFWRIVFAGVALALGAFLFWIPWSRGHALLAGFTALFFAGSRWTVFVTFAAQVDFLPGREPLSAAAVPARRLARLRPLPGDQADRDICAAAFPGLGLADGGAAKGPRRAAELGLDCADPDPDFSTVHRLGT